LQVKKGTFSLRKFAMAETAYVPGFEHDIFVSYARVDDEPMFVGESGWVSTLQRLLSLRLRQLLGRDCFSVWRDQNIAKHIDFEPQIVTSLERSASLLLILSPGYLASPWCEREMRTFLKIVRERGILQGGVFLVQREKIDYSHWPAELERAGLKGYHFWAHENEKQPRPLDDQRDRGAYFDSLNDLASEMAAWLKKMRHSAVSPVVPNAESEPSVTVFLAETTDDVDSQRNGVKRHLEQGGLRVVPNEWYPRDPKGFAQAVQEDLAQAKLFVQLLSPIPGRQMPGRDETYIVHQYRAAVAKDLPILQWRDPDLGTRQIKAEVADLSHQELLLGASVNAVDIEDFKRDVLDRANRKERVYTKPEGDAFVFVNTATADCPLASDLCRYLDEHGFGYLMPDYEGRPEEIRASLRDNILMSDGMIVVYGNSESNWVRGQLIEARKAAISQQKRLRAAVYEGPPTPKLPLAIKLPKMHVIACHQGLDEQRLQPFLDELISSLQDRPIGAEFAIGVA
jgi:hypothetical protein